MKGKLFLSLILVVLLSMLVVSPAFAADAIIINGDFEDNDGTYPEEFIPMAWISEYGVTEYGITQGVSGDGVFIESKEANDARLLQKIDVNAKSTYLLSCDILQVGAHSEWGANISLEDTFVYAGGQNIPENKWTHVELYFETVRGQKNIEVAIRLGGYGSDSAGRAVFDNFTITEVEKKNIPADANVHSAEVNSSQESVEEDTDGMKFFGETIFISLGFALILLLLYRKNLFLNSLVKGNDEIIYILLIGGLVVSVLGKMALASMVYGYPNDIACWMGWTNSTIDYNLFGFYQEGVWCDYPPGYLYILRLVGFVKQIFNIDDGTLAYQVLVKMPAIIADTITAILIYKVAERMKIRYTGAVLALLYAFSPAIVVNSAAWGQIDSVLALFIVGYVYFLMKNKFLPASLMLVAGLLIKPQMLLFGPIIMVVFINYWRSEGYKKSLKQLGISLVAGIAMFAILVVPFNNGQEFNWIFEKYFGTLSQYPYATLSACNFYAIFGGIWAPNTDKLMGITYLVWSYIGTISVIVYFIIVSMKDKGNKFLLYNGAMLITGLFMLGPKMHERYMYPALILLLLAWLYNRDKRIFIAFSFFSITHFINVVLTLANEHLPADNLFIIFLSFVAFSGFIIMCIWAWKFASGDNMQDIPKPKLIKTQSVSETQSTNDRLLEGDQSVKKLMGPRDWIIVGIVTIIYAAIAFTSLGDTKVPQTMWECTDQEQSFIVNFEEDSDVRGFWLYKGLSTSRAELLLEYDDNGTWTEYVDIDFSIDPYADEANQLYRWFTYGGAVTTNRMRVTIKKPLLRMIEIGFKDTNGDVLPIMGLSEIIAVNADDPYKLIDEQDLIPASYSYMNSFYFDEIYHVRTAWEHLNFIEPYETTHPPLGKVIISLGIKIFGMTPFGWRFMGTLFGTLMIPIMYMLTKAIFKKRIYAFVGMFLLTFDFMHFAQTRIATIDTYVVFFIMCSYLFMYMYYKKNYNLQSIKSTIFPLAMSGLFFGLSAASKWTGIYAGIGLGIIFFYSVSLRYQEYLECSRGKSKNPHANRIAKDFKEKTIITILICGVLFIIVPIIVYTASYIPYMSIPTPGHGLSAVWDNQINMYNYHSGLVAEHTYQSAWYTWPLNMRPVWFYSGSSSAKEGMVSSISTYGSPAVWWAGTLAVLYLLYLVIFKKAIKSRTVVFLSIGYLAQLLPWVPVTRCTFIYHYFPAVPFSILIIVYCMKFLNEKFKDSVSQKNRNLIIYGYLALVLIVFIAFFPTFSGMLAPKGYIRFLQSIPSWFFGAF